MIIFDCDGVLLDSEVIADRILCESLSELINKKENHHEMSDPSFVQQWLVDLCGQTDEEILNQFSELTEIQLPHDFLSQFQSSLFKSLGQEVKSISGIKRLLISLGENWAVASNSSFQRLRVSLKQADLYDLCESRLFSSEQVERPKPAPDLHLHISRKFKIPPPQCLVVEDSPAGVIAALKAGMRVVGFTAGSHITPKHIEMLKQAGATNIVNDVEELTDFINAFEDGLNEKGLIEPNSRN